MQKGFDITIRDSYNFRDEVCRISNKLHEESARYIVTGSKQHQSIHKFRVCIKKLRGILRLLRHEIPAENYNEYNSIYREVANQVGTLRDYTSQIVLLNKMLNQLKNSLLNTTLKKEIQLITKKRESDYKRFIEQKNDIYIQQRLLTLKDDFKNLEFAGNPNIFLKKSLKKVYRRAKIIHQQSDLWSDSNLFHNWRKQIKYLMFQLMVVYHVWPKQLNLYINELDNLQKTLGKMHDLHHFKQILRDQTYMQINTIEQNALLKLVHKKENVLKKKAELIGSQLLIEGSESFSNRMYKLWMLKYFSNNTRAR